MFHHPCDGIDIDQHHTAIHRLPQEWQRLFQNLVNPLAGLQKAEVWFVDQYSSQYGVRPMWTDLLQSLSAAEPLLNKDGSLSFLPRQFTFPSSSQRNFLMFVRQHLDIIPSEALWKYLTEVFNNEHEFVDSWMQFLVQDLMNSLKNLSKPEKVAESDTPNSDAWSYSFGTEENTNLFKQLCSDIKRTQSQLELHYHYGYPDDFKDAEGMEITSLSEVRSPELIGSDNYLTGDEDRTFKLSVRAEGVPSDSKDPPMKEDISMVEKPIVSTSKGQNTQPVRNDLVPLEAPPVKRLKLEAADISFSATQGDLSLSQVSEPLSAEDWAMVAELKEVWHCATADTPVPDQIRLFIWSTAAQVVDMCVELELDSLSDVAMATACDHICSLGDQLSSSNCGHILAAMVLPKVRQVSQTMSRSLISIMSKLSKQFPRQLIEQVITSCVQDDTAAPSQSEMICKVTKENFTDANRTFLMQKLLEDASSLSPGMLALLQLLIDLKVSMDKDTLRRCVCVLREGSTLHAENLKFGKLLLAFVTKYGKQMEVSDVEPLKKIEAENKTFLKKAIAAALAKL